MMDESFDGGGGENGSRGRDSFAVTVLTCEGNINDPLFLVKLECLVYYLKKVTQSESPWFISKVEPWNSVRVTFSIPREAALRLHQLAQQGEYSLRQLGILSVQVEGDQVVSLRLAGPHNEPTDIVLRHENAVSDEAGSSNIGRTLSQAHPNASVLSNLTMQPPPPRFRSPTVVAPSGDSVPSALPQQQATVQARGSQAFPYANMAQAQQSLHRREIPQNVASGSTGAPPPQRSVYNLPPPYPVGASSAQLENVVRPPSHPHPSVSSSQGSVIQQYPVVTTAAKSGVTLVRPCNAQHAAASQVNVNAHMPNTYQISGVQPHLIQSSQIRSGLKTGVSVVKSSPLLVGLLSQQDHAAVTSTKTKPILATNAARSSVVQGHINSRQTAPVAVGLEHSAVPNLSMLSSGVSTSQSGSGSNNFSTSLIEELTAQESYTSKNISDSAQLPQKVINSAVGNLVQHLNPAGQISLSSNAPRLPYHGEPRRTVPPPQNARSQVSVAHSDGSGSQKFDRLSGLSQQHPVSNSKDSQYLINPNTGLLEPRANTDSSDSEADIHDGAINDDIRTGLFSDEESNMSGASKKETDQSDSDASRLSVTSYDSCRLQDRKSWDRDASPSSRETLKDTSQGEKIKLRLKYGTGEQVAQATIVASAAKKADKKEQGVAPKMGGESRTPIPKLHIKLHQQQPVIVNPINEDAGSNRKPVELREDKNKRKGRKLKAGESGGSGGDDDGTKPKLHKAKSVRERGSDSDATPKIADRKNIADLETDSLLKMHLKDPDLRKVDMVKSSKVDNKLRCRLKAKPQMRKVGDLNSVGGIASHKILETLPPSITKVAALHTQQPHRNPSSSSSSSLPFSSSSLSGSTSSTLSSAFPSCSGSVANAVHSLMSGSPSGDLQKTDFEKWSSEILPKSDIDSFSIGGEGHVSKSFTSKGVMNGDLSHTEKVAMNRIRQAAPPVPVGMTPTSDLSSSSAKLAVKRKGSDDLQSVDPLKDLNEGNIPTFFSSSMVINKVSQACEMGLVHPAEDLSSKSNSSKPGENSKQLCSDLVHFKGSSDLLQNISKDALEFDKILESVDVREALKAKIDQPKVGRVTCVDVMDRQALKEALKSSCSSSSKSNDAGTGSQCSSSTANVEMLLRRCSSINSSVSTITPITVAQMHPPSESRGDSHPINTGMVNEKSVQSSKEEFEQVPYCEEDKVQGKSMSVSSAVTSKIDCDNNFKEVEQTGELTHKMSSHDFTVNILLKGEVESPDGTPKGEHGSGQGGEDSGIESMDALSEKSPNQSDQSPNRRDEKEGESFLEKANEKVCIKSVHADAPKNAGGAQMENGEGSKGLQLEQVFSSDSHAQKDCSETAGTFEKKNANDGDNLRTSGSPGNEVMVKSESSVNSESLPLTSSTNVSSSTSNIKDTEPCLEEILCSTEHNSSADASADVNMVSSCDNGSGIVTSKCEVSPLFPLNSSTLPSSEVVPRSESGSTFSSQERTSAVSSILSDGSINSQSNNSVGTTESVPVSEVLALSDTTGVKDELLSERSYNGLSPSSLCNASVSHVDTVHSSMSAPQFSKSLLALTLTRPTFSTVSDSQSYTSTCESLSPGNSGIPPLIPSGVTSGNSCCPVNIGSSSNGSTMVIIATSSATGVSSVTSAAGKVLTLKSPASSPVSTTLTAMSKTFRVVALPGSNTITASANPIKRQLVALKQVMVSQVGSTTVKSPHLVHDIPTRQQEDIEAPPSLLRAHLMAPTYTSSVPNLFSRVNSAVTVNGSDVENEDFVGFSTLPKVASDCPVSVSKDKVEENGSLKSPEVLSPNEEEPTPLRLHPPLYTYGNRERTRELEFDAEEKETEDSAKCCLAENGISASVPNLETVPDTHGNGPSPPARKDPLVMSHTIARDGEKLGALTIEIPTSESPFLVDKKQVRSTRHSARLASPKVPNSSIIELSPKIERHSPSDVPPLCKPSPVSFQSVTVSPGPSTRGAKRRRHESESSSASSLNDDLLEPPLKSAKRKSDKSGVEECELKEKASKIDKDNLENDFKVEGSSSDEESIADSEASVKKRVSSAASSSANEEEEDNRPLSRSSRSSSKMSATGRTITRSRERQSSADSTGATQDLTPTRRASRQTANRTTVTPAKDTSPDAIKRTNSPAPVANPAVSAPVPSGKDLRSQKEKEADGKDLRSQKEKEADERKGAVMAKKGQGSTRGSPKEKCTGNKDKASPGHGARCKKESEAASDEVTPCGNRRKTRSASNVQEDHPNKRRRQPKEK